MLFTGSISNMDASKYDEVWVCVRSLGNVKTGGNVYHVPQLSPSKELFLAYLSWKKQGIWSKEQFDNVYTPQFLKEMESPEARSYLNLLKEKIKTKDIYVCCFCDDESLCHRSLIRRLLLMKTKTIAFTGRRPKDLCGYDYNCYKKLVSQLTDILDQLYSQGYTCFISGGAQGFDQLAFWSVNCLKRDRKREVDNTVFVPFKGQECRWAKDGAFGQKDFAKMLNVATNVNYLSDILSDYKEIVNALHNRNHAMINNCDLLVALYPSDDFMTSKGGTAEAMRYAKSVGKPILQLKYVIANNEISIVSANYAH